MFIINERAPSPARELIELLRKVEPATVGHFRHYGFVDPAIRPLIERPHVVGPAVTVKTPGSDSTIVHKVMEMVEPGDVIVVDRCGDHLHACWGGLVTMAAHLRGVAGGIVDGPATDVEEIIDLGFPLYCRGLSAMTTKLQGFGGEVNTVVQCGGVIVHPGDLILADSNGILILGLDEAAAVAEKALAMEESEKEIIEGLKGGKSLPSLTGANKIIAEAAGGK